MSKNELCSCPTFPFLLFESMAFRTNFGKAARTPVSPDLFLIFLQGDARETGAAGSARTVRTLEALFFTMVWGGIGSGTLMTCGEHKQGKSTTETLTPEENAWAGALKQILARWFLLCSIMNAHNVCHSSTSYTYGYKALYSLYIYIL